MAAFKALEWPMLASILWTERGSTAAPFSRA
jgi:hypothetical protein